MAINLHSKTVGLLVDCGGMFELSEDKPTVTIASPNYPAPYNPSQRCQWTIRVTEIVTIACDESTNRVKKLLQCILSLQSPTNTKIKLTFEKFEVELREDDTCGDYLEVRFTLPGQPGIK